MQFPDTCLGAQAYISKTNSNHTGWRLALQQEEQEEDSSPQPVCRVGLRKQRTKETRTYGQRKRETKKS